jgi:hypothetical protein
MLSGKAAEKDGHAESEPSLEKSVLARITNPCDENTEDTSKSEQSRSTRDRLALSEEHIERPTGEHKVDPCKSDHVGLDFNASACGGSDSSGRG